MSDHTRTARMRSYLGGFIAVAILAPALTMAGDNDPATSDVLSPHIIIPYDGHLALDNTPMNGQLNLRFELYDAAQGGALVWTEDQSNVSFFNGKFSVGLGSVVPLDSVVLDAERVWLAIQIDDGTGAFFPLSGRQAITPTPYASWAAHAADFDVAGTLRVAGNTQFDGPAVANDVFTSTRRLQISQTTNDPGLRLTRGTADWNFGIDSGNLQIRNTNAGNFAVWTDGTFRVNEPATSNAALMVGTGPTSTIAANRQLVANSGAVINGDLAVNGKITTIEYTPNNTTSQNGSGTSFVDLPVLASEGVCFLTSVEFSELDAANETGKCTVSPSPGGGPWRLFAVIANSPDATTECKARCISW